MNSAVIIKPRFSKYAPRQAGLDPICSYLASFLRSKGVKTELIDCYRYSPNTKQLFSTKILQFESVILILNQTVVNEETLYDFLRKIENSHERIILVGFIASSFKKRIKSLFGNRFIFPDDMKDINNNVEFFCNQFINGILFANPDFILDFKNLPIRRGEVLPIRTSLGCDNNCSFCAYNLDFNKGWVSRPVEAINKEIDMAYRIYGIKDFSICDSNFCGSNNDDAIENRIFCFVNSLQKANNISFSMNINLDKLSKNALEELCATGLRSVITGIESFQDNVRIKLFSKSIEMDRLTENINFLERKNIPVLTSVIIFHPYTTIDDLKKDLQGINSINSLLRIPQLFVNSKLHLFPSTDIWSRIEKDGLFLKKGNNLVYDFIFKDEEVKVLYDELRTWHKNEDENDGSIEGLNHEDTLRWLMKKKIREYNFLKSLIGA